MITFITTEITKLTIEEQHRQKQKYCLVQLCFSKNATTKINRYKYSNFIDNYFTQGHKFLKIGSRNNIKVSCMLNTKSGSNSHNTIIYH